MNKYDVKIVFDNCENIVIAKRNIKIMQLMKIPSEQRYNLQIEIEKDGDEIHCPFDLSYMKENAFNRIIRKRDIVYLQLLNLFKKRYYVPYSTYKDENIYQESKILPNGNLFLLIKLKC